MTIAKAVCALILCQDDPELMLGISRQDDKTVFGLIGGKVDPGETLVEAIVREVREETGFGFSVTKKVFDKVCYGERDFDVTTFIGTIDKVIPIDYSDEPSDEGVVKWCTKAEMLAGPFGEYNKVLFQHLGIL